MVALVSTALIPGFTLALGFLLGGIISPPDAISATTVMRRVDVPKSLVSIIEGESLLNDASSLIIFRFAIAAVITGQFHLGEAATSFFLVIVMGTAVGLVLALFFYAIHRWLPTTTSIEIVLSLVTPYCMYYFAEHFHFSGVLSVVSGGLLLSSMRQKMLTYRSRIEAVNVWSNIVFVLNGLIFLLIGLQLPSIIRQLGNISVSRAIVYGLVTSFLLILTRMLCTFGASLFTRLMSRVITVADPNPGWKAPLITGWAGMRGVVSLAAALSIPVFIREGQPFPYRDLILFITFIVILVTLVMQGLTLPWLIRKIKMEDRFSPMSEKKQEIIIQKKIAQYTLQYLEDNLGKKWSQNERLKNLHARLNIDLDHLNRELEANDDGNENTLKDYNLFYLELLEHQRKILNEMNRRTEFDEDLIRKYLSLIDLEEHKLREKLSDGVDVY